MNPQTYTFHSNVVPSYPTAGIRLLAEQSQYQHGFAEIRMDAILCGW
jgi:hypothetical protein